MRRESVWKFTQRRMVVPCRSFCTTYLSHIERTSSQSLGMLDL